MSHVLPVLSQYRAKYTQLYVYAKIRPLTADGHKDLSILGMNDSRTAESTRARACDKHVLNCSLWDILTNVHRVISPITTTYT